MIWPPGVEPAAGEEAGTRAATANPTWNSVATQAHGDGFAIHFKDFNISQHLGSLQAGANVLAIHGLNAPSGAKPGGGSDFLILPELHGGFAGAAAAQPKIDFGKVEAARWLIGVVGTRRLLHQDRHHRENAMRDIGTRADWRVGAYAGRSGGRNARSRGGRPG